MRVRIRDVVAPVFWPVHRAIARGTVQELVAKGGRGSGKSSYISIELVLQLLRHPACHAVVLRKIGGTLRTSVYAQIQWAIGALGLAKQFRCTVSPMECTYLPTGQNSLSKNPIIKLRNSRPRLQKSKNISQKLASKGVSTPSLQAFSDSWQQI